MEARLIIYNLESESDNSIITNKIKSNSSWAKITDNCWIIMTKKSNSEVRDELKDIINDGSVLVMTVTGQGWSTYNIPKEVTNWMKNNQKIYDY